MVDNETRIQILSGVKRLDIEKIIARVRTDLKRYTLRSDVDIPTTPVNTIRDELVSVPSSWSREKSDADYERLLAGKVKDSFMKSQIKRHWELTGQLKTVNRMTLVTNKGNHPRITVLQTAPEHRYSFSQWWLGQSIDSNNFLDKVKSFTDKWRSIHGIHGTTVESHPSQSCKVIAVRNEVTLY